MYDCVCVTVCLTPRATRCAVKLRDRVCVWVLFSVRACAIALTVQCVVRETVENLAGFQRVYGCAQHVTLGESFLTGGCQFAANFDRVRCVRLRACARPLVRDGTVHCT